VSGISGHTLDIDLIGHLKDFFDVLADHNGSASVLCMADVEDMYEITYESGHSYTVHLDDRDLTFYRKGKLYIGSMLDWQSNTLAEEERQSYHAMVTTVTQNESSLTSRELKRVKDARVFIKNTGYPSLKEAVHLAEDGNIDNSTGQARMSVEHLKSTPSVVSHQQWPKARQLTDRHPAWQQTTI